MKSRTTLVSVVTLLVVLLIAAARTLPRTQGARGTTPGAVPPGLSSGGRSRALSDSSSGTMTPLAQDPWATMRRRPLDLPQVPSGKECPALHGKQVSPDFGLAIGRGPIYPVGLGSEGVLRYSNEWVEGGWFFAKVLWVGDPAYTGPVLVRGHQIDGPGELRFGEGADPPGELRLDTAQGGSSPSHWYNWPSYTRLRVPGCYAYQVDGTSFSDVIVFRAAGATDPEPTVPPGR
ncbi:MAG: hypothetical protein M3014_05040 [Chloroflexota bacterium]|nr:hypothetical protein [Chloroflexota bacterium]